ncbi:HTH-type transcriptional regulator YdeO [Andreprevotia sp. IGB-42]|uniref:helix-turn-helix transcriptional regulator n=1 Tax=Andreprevotia sp. IGB-42 TaxID=2497473 RepID=UPI001357AE2A|nr:AraC family transcriptional regulator [Andreprevotia sp. IGB-42]KAF0813602.1 HTH-type transcriptional regulator YdeO [Andreprevotia sp. IGB-42]
MSTIYQELFDIDPRNVQHSVGARIFHHPHLRALADHDVLLAGVSYVHGPLHVERIGAPFHIVLLSVEGEGLVIDGAQRRLLGPGQMAILPAYGHSGFCDNGGYWRTAWFLLNDSRSWAFLQGNQISMRPVIAAENLFHATALTCLEAQQEHEAFTGAAMLLAVDLLKRMLASTEAGDEITRSLQALFDAVKRDPAQPWRVEDLAARQHLSRAQFQRQCLRYLGVAPQQMIINQRMARARELLLAGFGNVGAVAEAVGYEEIASFSRRFSRHFGTGPGDVLRELALAPKEIGAG